jgi:uncharacterized membrane protein
MRAKNLDLMIVLFFVVINIVWVNIPNRPVALGIVLVLPLMFVLPGYVLTDVLFRADMVRKAKLLFGRNSARLVHASPIELTDQIVLSLGLSLAIDVLVGFGLNVLPIGLRATSWAFALGVTTTIFTVLAALLRSKNSTRLANIARFRVSGYNVVVVMLAVGIIAASVWLAVVRPLNPQPSFTQFWMLPAKNDACAVSIGVQSFETTVVTYRVVMTINNGQPRNWSSVVLTPQQEWSQSVVVNAGSANSVGTGSLYVQAQLYRADKPTAVYRSVHVTLHEVNSKDGGAQQKRCQLGT